MNKLLITTAMVASMGFATGAFAQTAPDAPIYEWTVIKTPAVLGDDPTTTGVTETTFVTTPAVLETRYGTVDQFNAATGATFVGMVNADENTNSLAGNQESLLSSLLAKADDIQSSLANTSENLGNINGSINLDMTRFDTELPDVSAGGGTTGGLATISEPIKATLGNLTTTVIGSLGTGAVDSTAILSSIDDLNQAVSANSKALSVGFTNGADGAAPAGLQQIYNLSSNLGALNASVNVDLAGVTLDAAANIPGQVASIADGVNLDSMMASWSTTAIGSLGDGKITSDLTNNAAALTTRLVGTN